jgi:hypothetical protein
MKRKEEGTVPKESLQYLPKWGAVARPAKE